MQALLQAGPRAPTGKRLLIAAAVLVSLLPPQPAPGQPPAFLPGISGGSVNSASINEASGLAASRQTPHVLWTHNDSGDSARLFAINRSGALLGIYTITGASATDWEDIAIAPDPVTGVNHLYAGDIGDNNAVRSSIRIYRIPEPGVDTNQFNVVTNLAGAERYTLVYEDGARDAETLMVDPASGDIYIVSKRETPSRIYRAVYPHSTNSTITLQFQGTLKYGWAVGGDISPSGLQVLIKQSGTNHYYHRTPSQTFVEALTNTSAGVACASEPQGESVAWQGRERGYYTLSEGTYQPVYYYASADTDDDGLPDSEEVAHQTDMNEADSDGDGQTDGEEVIAGTSPTNASSLFSLASVSSTLDQVTLAWPAYTGRSYSVEYRPALSDETTFVEIASNITVSVAGTYTTNFVFDSDQAYYRIRTRQLSGW